MIQGALRQMLCNKIMSITFINQVSGTARIPKAVLLGLFKRTQKLYKKKIREKSISVIFVSENESKKLNSKYRNKAYATNVLSFESFSKKTVNFRCVFEQFVIFVENPKRHDHGTTLNSSHT